MNECLQIIAGGYSKIKFLRFTLLSFALIDAAAHLYASPSSFPYVIFWLEIEVAAFIVIGMVFLLGLKIWYLPSVLFTLFNLAVYLLSGLVALPPISPETLSGHIQFVNYSFDRAFSMIAWLYIIIMGLISIKVEKGSKLNDLMKEDKS
ncbi:MAG: hypothetical protein ACYCSG_02900 [Thermoplasmataceae archaeon]